MTLSLLHPSNLAAHVGAGTAAIGLGLAPRLLAGGGMSGAAPGVIYASLATLGALLAYDAGHWRFPRRWHASLWRFEHIYKMVASLFAMLSAATGNCSPRASPGRSCCPRYWA